MVSWLWQWVDRSQTAVCGSCALAAPRCQAHGGAGALRPCGSASTAHRGRRQRQRRWRHSYGDAIAKRGCSSAARAQAVSGASRWADARPGDRPIPCLPPRQSRSNLPCQLIALAGTQGRLAGRPRDGEKKIRVAAARPQGPHTPHHLGKMLKRCLTDICAAISVLAVPAVLGRPRADAGPRETDAAGVRAQRDEEESIGGMRFTRSPEDKCQGGARRSSPRVCRWMATKAGGE